MSAIAMFKQSRILLSCCNSNLPTLCVSGQISRTSPLPTHAHPSQASRSYQQCRSYAIVSDGHCGHEHGDLRWPEVTSANRLPTPYQIFNQKKGSPYSKQRFYELVKMYHPDRHHHNSPDGLSYATKIERYRLTIAANDILSDPVKRGAYDCYGAGWNGQPNVVRDPSESWSNNGKGWGDDGRGPSQNATWEDWENWYKRDGEGPQEPTYVSNGAFVGLIVIFAAIGGIGQFTRVGNYSSTVLERRDALHDHVSKDLMRRRRDTTNDYGHREQRIHSFLRQRDPHGYGLIDPVDESYRRLLPNSETCSSEDIKGRSTGIYQQKSNPKDG
ncbi:Chaperone J-domain-containing protein [Venustampulla echinocandica]|uniref:Chaperone J-domain-containing protein n=1 Tax=Venustampulla echinocandica TaxID=2656787 RepID=A0A370TCE6_9HELO|nr:Chaperone J-domain-containing protein [Venustampulla echinocandica]RDL31930.1 Chaperone J-domain-containing protein [Venustampulla echinocandica]